MFAVYKRFDLVKDTYFIEYWFNNNEWFYAKLYFWESHYPKTYVQVGMVAGYYESIVSAENGKQHWTADCHLEPNHIREDLVDNLGRELLEHTSCKEPFLLNVFKGTIAGGNFRKYGKIYSEE